MKESTKRILEMPSSMTCKEVAEELGLTYNQVLGARRTHGINYARKKQSKVSDYKLMHKMIGELIPYAEIGKVLGVAESTIAHHAAKIKHRRNGLLDDEGLISDYLKKLPLKRIEVNRNCSVDHIYRTLKKHGIPTRRSINKAGN